MREEIFFLEMAFGNGFIFSEVIMTLILRACALLLTISEVVCVGTVCVQSHSECSESEVEEDDAESEMWRKCAWV